MGRIDYCATPAQDIFKLFLIPPLDFSKIIKLTRYRKVHEGQLFGSFPTKNTLDINLLSSIYSSYQSTTSKLNLPVCGALKAASLSDKGSMNAEVWVNLLCGRWWRIMTEVGGTGSHVAQHVQNPWGSTWSGSALRAASLSSRNGECMRLKN